MKSYPRISESEWVVLLCFRKSLPLEIKDIVSRLKETYNWNANMVRALIVRLQNKGIIAADKTSSIYKYYPVINIDEHIVAITRKFINMFYNGNLSEFIQIMLANNMLQSSGYIKKATTYEIDDTTETDVERFLQLESIQGGLVSNINGEGEYLK